MKRVFMQILFPAVGVIFLASCRTADFTVASYNIRSFRQMDYKKNVPGTIAAIGRLNSDICGVQEIRKLDDENPSPFEVTGKTLDMSPFFCCTVKRNGYEYGIGALSRFDAKVVTTLKLPQLRPKEPRSALILKVHAPQGSFYFISTHLVNRKSEADERMLQLKCILDYVKTHQLYPVILTGDLNASPDSDVIRMLKKEWYVAGSNEPTFPAKKVRIKLDYIAFYPKDAFEVVNYQVGDEPLASDHRPVSAGLRFKKNSK